MNYQETIAYLYASQPAFHLVGAAAYKPGLDNTLRLMQHLGNPHEQLRAVLTEKGVTIGCGKDLGIH